MVPPAYKADLELMLLLHEHVILALTKQPMGCCNILLTAGVRVLHGAGHAANGAGVHAPRCRL
jgi:hypothetical protein